MGIPIYQVDAFTEVPFKGNPPASAFSKDPPKRPGCRASPRR